MNRYLFYRARYCQILMVHVWENLGMCYRIIYRNRTYNIPIKDTQVYKRVGTQYKEIQF